jgi:hypothetical protein
MYYWRARYWVYRTIGLLRPRLARFYPKWMVTDALIHAGVRKIRDHEVYPEVPFMTVYERWYKEGR